MRLRDAGFQVMMDDCFSASSMPIPIRNLRLDGYKIDKDLIDGFLHNRHDKILITTLLFYCKASDISCVAEGIDNQDKFDKLVSLGLQSFQGYYLSEPVPEEVLSAFIEKRAYHNSHVCNLTRNSGRL